MKLPTLLLGVALLPFLPASASAELICYQGRTKAADIGSGHTTRSEHGLFLVVDRDTGRIGEVTYGTQNGSKVYSTAFSTDFHIVQFVGANQTTNTALSRPPSDCETNNGPASLEHIFAFGANTKLPVTTITTISFPRVLKASSTSLTHISDISLDYYVFDSLSRILVFDKKRTQAANTAVATVDQAVAAFTDYLQSMGYSQ